MNNGNIFANKILNEITMFAQANKEVEALGLGGSWGMKREDSIADLDLFFLIDNDATESFLSDLQQFASIQSPILIDSVSSGRIGFGLIVYQVMYDGVVCDFFIDTRDSLKPHPLRKYSYVIVDKTGYYTSLITSTKSNNLCFDDRREFNELVRQFWFDCEKTYRALKRNHLWNALYYLNRLRLALFRIIRLSSNQIFIPDKPFKYFEIDFPPSTTMDLEKSLAVYNNKSIHNAYKFTIFKFIEEAYRYAVDHDIKWYIQSNDRLTTISSRWIDQACNENKDRK